MSLYQCRSNIYLVIGVCFGLCLSLMLTPIEITECQECESEFVPYAAVENDFGDEYEPKINVDGKPQRAQKTPKVFVRPRYYTTELGIREKIFIGVMTKQEFLHTRAIASNKTIRHLVDQVRYFIPISEKTRPNISLPGIVGFTDTRSTMQPFHMVKYIMDNYMEDYDYYFFVKDMSYVNARRLKELVSKLSVSRNVHLGAPSELDSFCSLDAGILLSNSVIRSLKNNMDWCVKNTYSEDDDVNFGRCILHASSIPCTSKVQSVNYLSTKLHSTFNFNSDLRTISGDREFAEAITVYPVFDHLMIYKLNAHFMAVELAAVQKKIASLRNDILKTSSFAPNDRRDMTWPIGNQPGNKAMGRFDILRWTYFNETHVFLENDWKSIRKLDGSQKADVDRVLNAAINRVIGNDQLTYKKLVNGYWKFDASRGMDYILDLNFATVSGNTEVNKRVEVSKPLGKVEILPVPYVTEHTRINMVLAVSAKNKAEAFAFMEHYAQACMEKKDKSILMMTLLYDPGDPSKGLDDVYYEIKQRALSLTEMYKKDQGKVTWLSVRLPVASSFIETEPLLKIAIADLSIKKFFPDSLVLLVDTNMELRFDYLNRVRMNTISQWQVFSPIPFVEFHPDITYVPDATKRVEFDITHNHGRYDEQNFDSISFYVQDYTTVRKSIEGTTPLVRNDKDIISLLKLSSTHNIHSIFDMFVTYGDLHSFRAVEPSLKLRYRDLNCDGTKNNYTMTSCMKRQNLQLGNRGQLTRLILDFQNNL